MRILLVGSGGVGEAFARIAARRDFYESIVVSDTDAVRAQGVVEWIADHHETGVAARFAAATIDPADPDDVAALAIAHRATHVVNTADSSVVLTVFEGALAADADYLDVSMSPSFAHPTDPYSQTGIKLGDVQFEAAEAWNRADRLALVGMGVAPGLTDVFARYAADHLFSEIDELGTRYGQSLATVDGDGAAQDGSVHARRHSSSLAAEAERLVNPPVIWEKGQGWYTTDLFSEPEIFHFPHGIGPVECVTVEHEAVLLMPRWVKAKRVTAKRGTVRNDGGASARSSVHVTAKSCAGLWVTGIGKDGEPREVYLHHVSDNAWTTAEYGSHCVSWQGALNPVIALELLARGEWNGVGVLGPEAFDSRPFLELMARPESEGGYGQEWGLEERAPAA